jgi:hypothetical protein
VRRTRSRTARQVALNLEMAISCTGKDSFQFVHTMVQDHRQNTVRKPVRSWGLARRRSGAHARMVNRCRPSWTLTFPDGRGRELATCSPFAKWKSMF